MKARSCSERRRSRHSTELRARGSGAPRSLSSARRRICSTSCRRSENVELALALRGVEGDEAAERADAALAAVGLAEHADRAAGVLSAGQRERVALARAFAARTGVVLADEPTARLDAATTLAIGRLLAELAHSIGSTVVCATHDPLLIGLADREVRLRDAVPLASASWQR